MLKLAGKGALVVGAKRVGQVVAERLAVEGVNIAIAYRSSKDEAEQLLKKVSRKAKRTALVQGDVSIERDVQRMIDTAAKDLGNLWFVINMASGFPRVLLKDLDGKAWDEGISAARGSYLLTAYGGRYMVQANTGDTKGHIVNFSDWAAKETPYLNYLPYLTAKAAIDFMTRGFAAEFAGHGVLVNAIAPGPTIMPAGYSPELWQRELQRTPLKRESSSEEIAEMIVSLLRSETITGETIRVDSGRHVAGQGVKG